MCFAKIRVDVTKALLSQKGFCLLILACESFDHPPSPCSPSLPHVPCPVLTCPVLSCSALPCPVLFCLFPLVLSYPVLPVNVFRPDISCRVIISCFVVSCPGLFCRALSCSRNKDMARDRVVGTRARWTGNEMIRQDMTGHDKT